MLGRLVVLTFVIFDWIVRPSRGYRRVKQTDF
jgi:hypothetical protein